MLRYYFINTDSNALGHSPHAKWIEYNHAFTSGNYEKFGVKALGKLSPNDVLFMSVNDLGIVAAGIVLESWVGSSYKGRDRLVYTNDEQIAEYRILVGWVLQTVNNPISQTEADEIVKAEYPNGLVYARAFQPINKREAAEKLLNEIKQRVPNSTDGLNDI